MTGADYRLMTGDCLEVMRTFYPNIFDTIITDSPYGLSFMGKNWDHGVPGVPFWAEMLRVAKPGAILLAFGGTRTHHRLMVAIEDAGWEIRDCLMWLYGSGFPKSHDISQGIDRHLGAERDTVRTSITAHSTAGKGISNELDERPWLTQARQNGYHEHAGPIPASDAAKLWEGWGTALKPAWEPIIVAMKPLTSTFAGNALAHGVAGLNIDGCRIETPEGSITYQSTKVVGAGRERASNLIDRGDGKTPDGRDLAAALERQQRYADNRYSTTVTGRWPANLILDQSAAALLDQMSGESKSSDRPRHNNAGKQGYHGNPNDFVTGGYTDRGGSSRYFTVLPDSEPRFFYSAKASTSERNQGLDDIEAHQRDASRNADQPSMNGGAGNPFNRGAVQVRNSHPTVKPLSLLRWLVKLTRTPTGGLVLDPFAGSGTTGVACLLERRSCVLIEREPEYVEISRHRLEHWQDEAEMTPIRVKGRASDYADSPLFAEVP